MTVSAAFSINEPSEPSPRARKWRRALLWAALVALLLVAQSLLVWLTVGFESNRTQEQLDGIAAGVAADVRHAVLLDQQDMLALVWSAPSEHQWRKDAAQVLRSRRELLRLERRDTQLAVLDVVDSPYEVPLFLQYQRGAIDSGVDLACTAAARQGTPAYSRSYFVPMSSGLGQEVVDVCLMVQEDGQPNGFMVGTLSLAGILNQATPSEVARGNEVSFIESDGTRLARVGVPRGAGVFRSERLVDVPGLSIQLRVESSRGRPQLIPNLTTALVLGLSLALGGVVALLARDGRKRAGAEAALAEALAFRKAMEDSLVTGLRARDLQGRITYVNPAFCQMVGFTADELVGQTTPYYWPPELVSEYEQRQAARMAAGGPPREGFESLFIRRNGERFPVMIFEAPLVDGVGRQTGWMSAALDISAQRRIEEMSRQQQERLQATARLATVGEMASLLSHELNQPLAAIASYATGSLNLMNDPELQADPDGMRDMLKQASQRIAEQAERAGRVIKSVHDFVRRREQAHEAMRADHLIESVLPLVRLQAHKSGARIEVDLPSPVPRVVCDRTMVEQVLLNLTRNGIQAMESHRPLAERELLIRVRQVHPKWVSFAIVDHGTGVPAEVASQLFTPFFTTRSEGMGLGLSLCRTVIEQHGGALDFENLLNEDGSVRGAEFRFTLATERPPSSEGAVRFKRSSASPLS
jgi:two-component system sensor histidine kinase DctS